jgi:HlyD family secretion protein
MRRLLWWGLIVGVLAGAAWGVAVPGVAMYREKTAPRYLKAVVSRGRVETVVNSTGTVKPVRSVLVGAFVSGPIKEVFVDHNSVVKKGQVLATIDPALPAAAVKRDEAFLRTQRAEKDRVEALLKQARNNEARGRKLMRVNKDYLSDTEMDQLRYTRQSQEAQLELAKASIEQAEATLENSKANLAYTRIVSPVSGVIIERKVDPGQTVAASFQTPELFTVAPDMDKHMHVFASVDEADIGLIRSAQQRGRPVRFTVDAYPRDLFTGLIYQLRNSSTTTQNVVTYPVVIEAKNTERKLMPGMTASLSFLIEERPNVVRVPAGALRFIPAADQVRAEDRHHVNGGPGSPNESGARLSATQKVELARGRSRRIVWVQDGMLLRAVPVVLGLIDNQFAELVEGDLEEGDSVVTGVDTTTGGRP